MTNLKKDAEKVLTLTQGDRTGPFGAYVPDEFKAFELGAQHALNYVIGLLNDDPGMSASMLIACIEQYRKGANTAPDYSLLDIDALEMGTLRDLLPGVEQLYKKRKDEPLL